MLGNHDLKLTRFAPRVVERRYDKGQLLYMPGDPADTLFLLRAGRVQQYHLSLDGRKLVTVVLKPGEIFGAAAITNGHGRHVFAEAMDDCVVGLLDRHQVEEILLREPGAILLLIERLAQRLSHAEKKLEELVFDPIPVRLARCLLETAEDGVVAGFSHQELSEMLGAYRETVTVTLNQFKEQGLIDIQRRRIVIRNQAGLEDVAHAEDAGQHGMSTHDPGMSQAGHYPLTPEIEHMR